MFNKSSIVLGLCLLGLTTLFVGQCLAACAQGECAQIGAQGNTVGKFTTCATWCNDIFCSQITPQCFTCEKGGSAQCNNINSSQKCCWIRDGIYTTGCSGCKLNCPDLNSIEEQDATCTATDPPEPPTSALFQCATPTTAGKCP
jgi:hypothetical protein